MQVADLKQATKLAGMIANQYSMATSFRCLQINEKSVGAYSEFGNILIECASGVTSPCLIDAVDLNSVLSSLPEKAEIRLTVKDTTLNWQCGTAKGHWAKVVSDTMTPALDHADYPWLPSKEFADALELASSACQASTVSIGIYGVVLRFDGINLTIVSSNSISLAEAILSSTAFPSNIFTIRPPVPNILAALLKDEAWVDITTEGIFVLGSKFIAHLPVSPALTKDLSEVSGRFTKYEHTTKINTDSVKKFLNRASALLDKNANTVGIAVQEGIIKLEQKGMAGSAEEFFISEGLPSELSMASVQLPIHLVEVALRGVELAVLDYLPEKVLILQGLSPAFRYIISGQ